MAKNQIRLTNNHQSELVKILRNLGLRHGQWQVFRDFIAMSAIALSNAADKSQFAEREAQYMDIVGRYSKDEANEIARGLAHVVMGLEAGHHDFLGSLFMLMGLGDAWHGQFFTPYEVCLMMSMMLMGDRPQRDIERKGYVTVKDPCVGGGAMVIASADTMLRSGINYQQHMHAVTADIDIVAVHMAYIQFSLLHIPAVVYHANSLSNEIWSTWRTPAHMLGFWDSKLRLAGDSAALVELVKAPELMLSDAPATPILDDEAPSRPAVPLVAARCQTIDLRSQLSLF